MNSPAEFSCNVSGLGSTPASISWMHNAVRILSEGGKFEFPQPHVLRISQTLAADSGIYQCFVRDATESDGGEMQSSAELVVLDVPPRLSSVFSEQTLHPGRSVSLHCWAVGSPAPSIVWTRDSFLVPYTAGR